MAERSVLTVPETGLEFGSEWFEFDGLSEPPTHLARDFGVRGGGWRISVERGEIRVWGELNEAYALLLQLMMQRPGYLPRVKITSEKRFGFRCFHLDIARGGVPKLDTFKRIVRWLFLLGYNALGV